MEVKVSGVLWHAGILFRICTLLLGSYLSTYALEGRSQDQPSTIAHSDALTFSTESVGPHRFIAAHGRRALISGYASEGLDVWAYPFQILRNYRVAFRTVGTTTSINGEEILSRVHYEPGWVNRVYLGPDFVVRERLFVPLDVPGAVLSYSVESSKSIEIEVHAAPVLDLMWPGAIGGQSSGWNASLHSFILYEPQYGYSAIVGSPDIVSRDPIVNRAAQGANGSDLAFTLRTQANGTANVFVLLNRPHAADHGADYTRLVRDLPSLVTQSSEHYSELQESVLQLESPDESVNKAFAWAEMALDQAWVCNPDLGCGYVGGYGPTRAGRRPQYDWFFAGDGLINAEAAVSEGDWAHARQELEFVLRYQDKKTGMIWHELSQSAGLIDWAGKYPYMFVHVDTTFQFLGAIARYVDATGDVAFAREHWPQLDLAYRYCLSVLDPATSLPIIPGDKEGANEQDRMKDDFGLSTSWVAASSGFAKLANVTGHAAVAQEASRAEQNARSAIPSRYWDPAESFWISGHTLNGQPMLTLRSGPMEAIDLHLFDAKQSDLALDRLASSSFETSWGTRGVALGSAGFDPESYASGSVWPLGTGAVATTFWRSHRPMTALAIWESFIPLSSLDSFGHIHEALAGQQYRAQTESVPEQTWSSSSFIDSTIHGLLGLDIDSVANRIVFAPRLPASWGHLTIRHVRLSDRVVSLSLHRTSDAISLDIENSGAPFQLDFQPDLPLGAIYDRSSLNDRTVPGKLEAFPEQTSANLVMTVPHGNSNARVLFHGGISLIQAAPSTRLGDPDTEPHIVAVHLDHYTLSLDVDVPAQRFSHLALQSAWKIEKADGVNASRSTASQMDLTFAPTPASPSRYNRVHATIQMAP
jgi:hypothetical protein